MKKSYKNNKFKIPAPTWNEEFELPDGSYSVSDIQEHFEYLFKKHETVNARNNEITCYLKTRHISKSCNIYLKPERFRKSSFTLPKVKSE